MELELKKTSLDIYEAGGELTLTQEETAETIVPDHCPDIARIIETRGPGVPAWEGTARREGRGHRDCAGHGAVYAGRRERDPGFGVLHSLYC